MRVAVGIGEAVTRVEFGVVEQDLFSVMAEGLAGWFADTVIDTVDVEEVQMIIVPTHGNLDDTMQIGKGGGAGESQASPDHRADTAECAFDRVDVH